MPLQIFKGNIHGKTKLRRKKVLFGLIKEWCPTCSKEFDGRSPDAIKISVKALSIETRSWRTLTPHWYCSSWCAILGVKSVSGQKRITTVLHGHYTPQYLGLEVDGKIIPMLYDINGDVMKDSMGYPITDSPENRIWLYQHYDD